MKKSKIADALYETCSKCGEYLTDRTYTFETEGTTHCCCFSCIVKILKGSIKSYQENIFESQYLGKWVVENDVIDFEEN